MGYTPLVTAPSEETVIYVNGVEEPHVQPEHRPSPPPQEHAIVVSETKTSTLHFHTGYMVYSFLLFSSVVGLILMILNVTLSNFYWTTLTVTWNQTADPSSHRPPSEIRVPTRQRRFGRHHMADSIEVAFKPRFLEYSTDIDVFTPPTGVRLSHTAAVVNCYTTAFLVLSSFIVLLVVRARHCAAAEEQEERAKARAQVIQASLFTGAGAGAVTGRPVTAATAEAAKRHAEERRLEAIAHQGFAVACFLLSFITLGMSVMAVCGNLSAASRLQRAREHALATYKGTIISITNDRSLSSNVFFWPHVVNLLLFAVMTVVLHVPRLSGIQGIKGNNGGETARAASDVVVVADTPAATAAAIAVAAPATAFEEEEEEAVDAHPQV